MREPGPAAESKRTAWKSVLTFLAIGLPFALEAVCSPGFALAANQTGQKTIVVTYSVLGAIVRDLIGDQAMVLVSMPNGQDPHGWEPSAKDIERIKKANLVVQNGLGLEEGMQKTLDQAKAAGVPIFTASDHISVRRVGPGEGLPTGDSDQATGALDPHLWTDPIAMKSVELALAAQVKTALGVDVSARARDLASRLDALDREIAQAVTQIPPANRRLVTGHESMGYFAQRYGFRLIGAIIPSLTSQAHVSAAELAALKRLVQANHVKAIFTELGTSPAVAQTMSRETGARVIEITTHALPEDRSYFTYMRNLTRVITEALK